MDKIYAKFKTEKWNNILTFTVACVGLDWVCFNDKYVLVAVWIGHSSDFPQTGRIFKRSLQLFRRGRSET